MLGGDGISALLAAAAAAIAPALAGFTTTLTTSTFEPLAWTVCSYFLVRSVFRGERRAIFGQALPLVSQWRRNMASPCGSIGLTVGIMATPERRVLLWWQSWTAVALAALLAAPSLVWQAIHGWPFFSAVFGPAVAGREYLGTPANFAFWQIILLNPVLCPLWLAGSGLSLSCSIASVRCDSCQLLLWLLR